jgi:AcrR family transcriptional regulator
MKDGSVSQRILDAAAHLFSEKGYSGTTTRDIARLAHVNECSVFRLFQTKEELFWAALGAQLGQVQLSPELQQRLDEDWPPERVMPLLMEFLVRTAAEKTEVIRLINVSLLEMRPQAEVMHQKLMLPILQVLVGYLSRCMQRGLMRQVDPALTAISLVAAMMSHDGLFQLLHGLIRPYTSSNEAVAAYSQHWLKLLCREW